MGKKRVDEEQQPQNSRKEVKRMADEAESSCHFWRLLAVGQGVACCAIVTFGLLTFWARQVYFDVPATLIADRYPVQQLPDIEFKRVAMEYANLVSTYQFMSAQPQFESAQKLLVEPMHSRFATEILGRELHAIRETHRTQIFYLDQEATEVERFEDDTVRVHVWGNRLRLVYGLDNSKAKHVSEVRLPDRDILYVVDLKVIPDVDEPTENDYGIVITNVDAMEL